MASLVMYKTFWLSYFFSNKSSSLMESNTNAHQQPTPAKKKIKLILLPARADL